MRFLLLLATALLVLAPTARAQARPERVASINLCADQYLLELADPGQILALSPYAADPALSYHARRAAPFARIADSAESVLTLKPDLVLASVYNNPSTLAFLRRQGVAVLTLSHVDGLDGVALQTRTIAAALGQPERGEDLLRRLEAAKSRAKNSRTRKLAVARDRSARPGRRLSALYFERGGYVAGPNSLMSELIELTGVANAARRFGDAASIPPLAPASVELVLRAEPDFLVVGDDGAAPSGEGAAVLRHPALRKAYPAQARLSWPVRETVCPGPSLIGALDRLAEGVERMPRRSRGLMEGLTGSGGVEAPASRCEGATDCPKSVNAP